ncbi:MAG: cupin domain-containing protein, partial [Acidimicrobiaceae bacterium]|nr:cupin domain-containing protein [Acidimicrobiaceae bacterium]
MAKTVTTTGVTHYEVQKKRRADLIEEARAHRLPTVIKPDQAELVYSPGRRMFRGVYAGADGDRPTRVLDATLHEVPPGATSTVHRHSWDAIMFVIDGRGWTEIDGQRIEWRSWDTLHLPTWAWHRHGNDGDRPARFTTWSVEPMFEYFGMAV